MEKRGLKPMFTSLTALVFLVPIVGSAGPQVTEVRHARMAVATNSPAELVRAAGARQEDCRIEEAARTAAVQAQCMWDQEDFQGNMKAADLSGQCTNYAIRSAANNGKSGSGRGEPGAAGQESR